MLLLMTNRKSHTRFRLVPKSNDLGWPWGAIMHSVSKHMRFSKPFTKNWMKMDSYYQQRICSSMNLVSGNIRFMGIFVGVPWTGEGASSDSGVIENVDFQGFRTLCLRHLTKWGQRHYVIIYYLVPCRLSTDPKIHDLEWPWMAILH